MCPTSLERGIFPPEGSNPQLCDRPIFGVYDDHDFGINNGNGREENKRIYKNLYLDAIGEPMSSIRRNDNRGAWTSYKLNKGHPKKEIDVILLDERYEREMLPCETKQLYCEQIVFNSPDNRVYPKHISWNEIAWCKDFLHGGPLGKGSCCAKDSQIYFQWCLNETHKSHHFYPDVCDVRYENFGMKSLVYDPVHDDIIPAPTFPSPGVLTDEQQNSPFCEVLGKPQRKWLRHLTATSSAPVKLFVSGSVAIYDPSPKECGAYYKDDDNNEETVNCSCGGDNIDCYRVAQAELLYLIQRVKGCAVILTGDYHFADIKVLRNGKQVYSHYYQSENFSQPIYQIMSSGLTDSTARNVSCEDYRLDPMGLRTHSECSFVRGPNFGRVRNRIFFSSSDYYLF
jgi:alkaline phosphatase D